MAKSSIYEYAEDESPGSEEVEKTKEEPKVPAPAKEVSQGTRRRTSGKEVTSGRIRGSFVKNA